MKILVTGATGFIGKTLCRRLSAAGNMVVALGRQPVGKKGIIDWVVADILSFNGADAPEGHKFDCVIHLAAAGVSPNDRTPINLINMNVRFGAQLLQEIDARAYLFAGSSAEYAQKQNDDYRESDSLQQIDIYGASKAAGSLLHLATANHLGKRLAIMRLFHVYGPGENSHRLTTSLFSALQKGERVALSPGDQIRDFVYIDDICRAFEAAAKAATSGRLETGAYNVCTGVGTSVKAVCKTVASIIGVEEHLLGFGDIEQRPNELMRVVGDPTLFCRATGWRPTYSVADGLRELRENLGTCTATDTEK